MSDNEPGEWAGEPNETTNETGGVVVTSPNRGDADADVTYRAKAIKDDDGNVDGNIFIFSKSQQKGVCMRYSTENGSMDEMAAAMETLKEGGVPDATQADDVNGDTEFLENSETEEQKTEGEEEKKETERRRFNLLRFLGLKKDKPTGFHIPFDNEEFDEMNGGSDGPIPNLPGPIVMWLKGDHVGIAVRGGKAVNAWMAETLQR